MTLANLFAWWVQVTIIAVAGAMLPLAFRLRESRGRLWYWHAMLLVCIAIPLVEPWVHPAPVPSDVTFTTGAFRAVGAPAATGFTIAWPAAIAIVPVASAAGIATPHGLPLHPVPVSSLTR